jgi:hypothetical protein
MIDVQTYFKLHSNNSYLGMEEVATNRFDSWPFQVSFADDMQGEALFMLPHSIHAFEIKEKKWSRSHIYLDRVAVSYGS